jgi:hypothetical protein
MSSIFGRAASMRHALTVHYVRSSGARHNGRPPPAGGTSVQPQNFQPQCAPTHFSTAATPPASSVHYWQLNKKLSKSGKSLTHQKVSKK